MIAHWQSPDMTPEKILERGRRGQGHMMPYLAEICTLMNAF